MFTNKKRIRIGLWFFAFLYFIECTIGYIQGYYRSSTGNELLISETWQTVLIDVPEDILVILGAITLYQFTKKSPEKTPSM
ncbi:DUF3937 family protein [Paenibacillus sp. 102]|uniref:DUF3937 family protein n=1 Tax=Paenibacillus sp. 102 TaxID=3120823 RepID=UPI0031BA0F06